MFDVFLNDGVAVFTVSSSVLARPAVVYHMSLDLIKVIEDFDLISSIRIFARFEDPKLVGLLSRLESSPLLAEFKVSLGRDQVSLWHIVEDVFALLGIVPSHV